MGTKILAVVILFLTVGFVCINTLLLERTIDGYLGEVEALVTDGEELAKSAKGARDLYERFSKSERYISLTVSHEDLTNVEAGFTDLISYLELGMSEEATAAKNRLEDALRHLGRLSVFSFDAIV
jgi:hypothetical protein